jgi:hypothetical protein
MAPALAIMGVINFMKTILLFATLIIASNYSHAAGNNAADQTRNATKTGYKGYIKTGNNGNEVLSVSFTNFNGVFSDNQEVDLNWTTMMESNVDHFEIQRSGDAMNFQILDSIESKMKISTSEYQLKYSYSDTHPLKGTSYYRVKVVGRNGYTTLSPVVQMNNNRFEGTRIYPTLVQNNMIFIESDKNLRAAKMEFFDLSGKKISETNWESLNGRQNVQISKSGMLPTGTYIARLSSNGQDVKTQLVIVQSH